MRSNRIVSNSRRHSLLKIVIMIMMKNKRRPKVCFLRGSTITHIYMSITIKKRHFRRVRPFVKESTIFTYGSKEKFFVIYRLFTCKFRKTHLWRACRWQYFLSFFLLLLVKVQPYTSAMRDHKKYNVILFFFFFFFGFLLNGINLAED